MLFVPLSIYAGINAEMFDAAKQGNIAKIKELLNKGADVNAKKNDGRTALMQASFTFGIGFSDW